MRVRTQLALALGLLAGFTATLISAVFFLGAREALFRQIQSTVLSIAVTAARGGIDVEAHERVRSPEDEGNGDYVAVQRRLQEIRDVNRREDVAVKFIYTMRPNADGSWSYVVDAEEPGDDHSSPGDPVDFEGGEPLTLEQPTVDSDFNSDEFGTWLSGTAPLVTKNGEPVALIGVDVEADDVNAQLNELLWNGVIAGGVALLSALALAWLISRWFTRPIDVISRTLAKIGEGDLEARVPLQREDEFGKLADAVDLMAVTLRERAALKRALARYVSHDVAEELLAHGEESLKGRPREVTILIVDIRNFTAITGQIPPEMLVDLLKRFFARMIEAIFSNRGTLDKFLGDGCLAIFGAPLDDPEHHRQAVRAALAMLAAMEELGGDFKREHGIDLRIGIALHSGTAIVGDVGPDGRGDYTAIGETVNVASRVEALNKQYGTSLLATEDVVSRAGAEFGFRLVAETQLRGVPRPVKIFTL